MEPIKLTFYPKYPTFSCMRITTHTKDKTTIYVNVNVKTLTKSHNAEGVSPDPGRALSGVSQRLGPRHLLAVTNHHGEPVGATVQVENETDRSVCHLLHAIAGHVAHRNTWDTQHIHSSTRLYHQGWKKS